MQIIQFNNTQERYAVALGIQSNRIICTFSSDKDALNAPLSNGFVELNEHNYIVQSDFSDYKYIYKKGADGVTYVLTNDENDVYVESDIMPTPELKPYIPTLNEYKQIKINNISNICNQNIIKGVDVEIDDTIEHFSYKDEDQINLKEIFDLAVETNVPMYYHADGESCKEYSVEQIITIYSIASANKNHHTTYFNQLKMYINSLEIKEEIERVFYGQALTGKYLDIYNASMTQAQLVLETLLAKRVKVLSEE